MISAVEKKTTPKRGLGAAEDENGALCVRKGYGLGT